MQLTFHGYYPIVLSAALKNRLTDVLLWFGFCSYRPRLACFLNILEVTKAGLFCFVRFSFGLLLFLLSFCTHRWLHFVNTIAKQTSCESSTLFPRKARLMRSMLTFFVFWCCILYISTCNPYCVQQGSRYKLLWLSTLFDTTLWKDIYQPLRVERRLKFFSYDLQTSHNTPLIMSAAMFIYAQSINNYPAYLE